MSIADTTISVLRGAPTDEELAVLTAVLLARATAARRAVATVSTIRPRVWRPADYSSPVSWQDAA